MRNAGRAGFTLLELFVVLFIISLLAALAFPSFTGFSSTGPRYGAGKMASLIRYLNDNAIASKKIYTLKFNLPGDSVSWSGPEGEKEEKIENISSIILQSKGEIKDGQVILLFGPLGLQEGVEVHFREDNKEMTVTFNPISGRAKINEEP